MKTHLCLPVPVTLVACLAVLAVRGATAQTAEKKPVDKALVFVKENPLAEAEADATLYEIGVLIEYISLDHGTANKLIRKFAPKAADAQELRDELEQLIDDEKAELIETAWVRARSGQRTKSESIREDIYPTEYDPPELPNTMGSGYFISRSDRKDAEKVPVIEPDSAKHGIPYTSATPAAFETRNVGVTFELDPVLETNRKEINLNISPELVARLEDSHYTREGMEETAHGIDHIVQPTFYTMKNTSSINAIPGNYNLIGIHTPPEDKEKRLLVLLRADLIPVK